MRKVIPKELSLQDKKEELCFAARRGDLEVVKQFFAEGLNANCIFEGNGYVTTPLKSAIAGSKEEMIKFLINEGADSTLEIGSSKAYKTCFEHEGLPCEKRLELLKLFIEAKPEIAEEVAKYITNRIPYLRRNDRLDETINSAKNPASKVKPNPSQSSPIVPMATNSGCVIS